MEFTKQEKELLLLAVNDKRKAMVQEMLKTTHIETMAGLIREMETIGNIQRKFTLDNSNKIVLLKKPNKTMNLMQYWKTYGIDHCREMADYAGICYEHFKHLCHKRKRPSVETAYLLIEFSNNQLTLEELFNINERVA